MAFHNLQQLSDAVDELIAAKNKDSENAASFLVSQVQPLITRISSLEASVSDLQAKLAALVGAPK